MPKYIEADWLLAEANMDGAYGYVGADQIAKAPTAHVVEVVRCKECKYWDRDDEYCVDFLTQDKNGFCSWWERREDEN